MKEPGKGRACIAKLLAGLSFTIRQGSELTEITSVASDSRAVEKGALFVAISGEVADGHDFIQEAVVRGCRAIIIEPGRCPDLCELAITVVEVADTREAIALVAGRLLGNPAHQLVLIGITGTNGKTTTSYILEEIIGKSGGKPGVIGTVNYRYNGQEFAAPFTTPEPVILHGMLQEMLESGVTHVIMEVSSHALVQKRVFGIKFDVAVFTNLSRDHLDFHGDMEEYFRAKKTLFTENLSEHGKAVVLSDTPWGKRLAREVTTKFDDCRKKSDISQVIRCGFTGDDDIEVVDECHNLQGTKAEVSCFSGTVQVDTPLVGSFNLKNILGALGAGVAMGYSCSQIESGLNSQKNVPGRLEKIQGGSGPKVYVDYAHTPDALENVLTVLKELSSGRIITVFGCGGDRDLGKRFLMGEVAGKLADLLIVTSDNSRSESTEIIMAEIARGLIRAGKVEFQGALAGVLAVDEGYCLIASRHTAIEIALKVAKKDDVVLIAGKGHETYQIVQGKKLHFDDREEAILQLNKWEKSAKYNR